MNLTPSFSLVTRAFDLGYSANGRRSGSGRSEASCSPLFTSAS